MSTATKVTGMLSNSIVVTKFMVMSFAQFTDRAGLRDIETTLNLCGDLYRSGIKAIPRSTLAEANEKKD